MSSTSELPTVLLVQGAWHHPDAWLLLRGELFLRGLRSVVTLLPSAGAEPTGSMHDDARAIRAALDAIEGPSVVLAHSYGGIPATEATASASGVARLIYLSAYVPDVGGSVFTLHGQPDPDDTNGLFPVIEAPRRSLYGDLPDAQAAAAEARLVDQTLQSFVDRVTAAGWRTVPSTYVISDQDQAIPPALQAAMARTAGADVQHIDSSHSAFLSQPGRLADLVLDLVRPA